MQAKTEGRESNLRVELPSDIVFNRLDQIGRDCFPIEDPPVFTSQSITRDALSKRIGGSSQKTFAALDKDKAAKHGIKRLMCPKVVQNPGVPEVAGAPGLFLRSSHYETDLPDNDHQKEKLIVGMKENVWEYKGEYIVRRSTPLSAPEWKMLSTKASYYVAICSICG